MADQTGENRGSTRIRHRYDPFADLEERHPEWELHVVPLGERQKKLIVWATRTIYLDRDRFIADPEFCVANVVAHVDGEGLPADQRDDWARQTAKIRLADAPQL